ncbi:hypothetical protein [Congregicoccus parvus]|uniref:hypothetical protein n=1 Tax=Congregicoccus parvus TaxID=3081749 RepID=UPI003FA54167
MTCAVAAEAPETGDYWTAAREALAEGRIEDAESVLNLSVDHRLIGRQRDSEVAEALSVLALEIADGPARAHAQEAVRRSRARFVLPTAKPSDPGIARINASRWHLQAMLEWKVFGNAAAAREAFMRAAEFDPAGHLEAARLADFLRRVDAEARIKSEANRRESSNREVRP